MYTRKQISDARNLYRETTGVKNVALLTNPTSNPKTEKNSKLLGILTAPLHFAPSNLSGYQVCPMASKGCIAACLHTAGNPVYKATKTKARINKTRFYFEHRESFLAILHAEITNHENAAKKRNMFAGVRLNATSDIAWETVKLPNGKTLFEEFPNITFYDYTAIPKRMAKFSSGQMPTNYFLTFSVKENNWESAESVLRDGGTATVVFDTKKNKQLPNMFKGFPVVDGDAHDYRPDDPKGCIAGLRAKGDAIGDKSGFVKPAK